MPKRRALVPKNGAAVGAALCRFDEARRLELGVEALFQLATEIVAIRAQKRDGAAHVELIDRYWRIIFTVSAERPPDLARVTTDMLVWMCLNRATRWMKSLVRVHAKERWGDVREMIVAWQDAWGTDARAQYAQARFATLTGLVRGPEEEHHTYLHTALIKALSDVQA